MSRPRVGLQLYTVREALANDLEATLSRVASIGFTAVEAAFFDDDRADLVRVEEVLRGLDLEVLAAHVELPVGADKDRVFRHARALGTHRIVWHGWPEDERYASDAGIHELAAVCNDVARVATANGLSFGIHNHWWEITRSDGAHPYRLLHRLLDPAVFFEFDMYWAQAAGMNPAEVLSELGDRVEILHVKDGPAGQHTDPAVFEHVPMVALGQGSVDVRATIAAAPSVEWLVIELDSCATDIWTAVAESRQYLMQTTVSEP